MCRFIIAALLFSSVPAAVADEVLTWESCLREAAQNHPELISAAGKIEHSRAEKEAAESQLSPQMGLSAAGQRGQYVFKILAPGSAGPGSVAVRNTAVVDNSHTYKLTGKQLLFDGSRVWSGVDSMGKKLAAAEYGRAAASSNIRLQLRAAFVSLLKAQESVPLMKDIAERRRRNLELVSLRYKGGREHRGALLTAEAQLAQAEFDISQAGRAVELSRTKLAAELGRSGHAPLLAAGELEVSPPNRARPDLEALAARNPFLGRTAAMKESARFDLKAAKADYYPKVYLDAALGMNDSDFPPGYAEWLAGLSVYLPLFDGGKRAAEVARSGALLRQYDADWRRERDRTVSALAQTWAELQDAIGERAVKEKFLRAAEERANIAGAQYSTGLISFNEWIIIEDGLVMSQKMFLDTKANVLLKEAYWVQAKGGTLEHE